MFKVKFKSILLKTFTLKKKMLKLFSGEVDCVADDTKVTKVSKNTKILQQDMYVHQINFQQRFLHKETTDCHWLVSAETMKIIKGY